MSVEGPQTGAPNSNRYEQIVHQAGRAHRLVSAHWELTYRCNERCAHCYLDVSNPYPPIAGELTTEQGLALIDQLAALGALQLTFSGGEPLVRRDWFLLAQHARANGFVLRLFTNGILIKPAVADQIASLHPYAVELSIYSAKPATHDAITRRRHSWELTIRAVRLLRERGVRVILKTPLMHFNIAELVALRRITADLDAQFRYDPTITAKDSGEIGPLAFRLDDQELLALMREEIDPARYRLREISDDTPTCGIAQSALAIDPYGNVAPCLQVRRVVGNVKEKSLRELWEESPAWRELALTLGDLPVCRRCDLRQLCVRCHGLALGENGDLTAPALVNCREALARRQALVEKGILPGDFPIPEHLRQLARGFRSPF